MGILCMSILVLQWARLSMEYYNTSQIFIIPLQFAIPAKLGC